MGKEMLFGRLAMRSGDISEDQLEECLDIQAFSQQEGIPVRLGKILREMGYMKRRQVRKVLRLQKFVQVREKGIQMAQKAIREGILKEQYLKPCLDHQKELFSLRGKIKALEDILVERNILSSRRSARLKKMMK